MEEKRGDITEASLLQKGGDCQLGEIRSLDFIYALVRVSAIKKGVINTTDLQIETSLGVG